MEMWKVLVLRTQLHQLMTQIETEGIQHCLDIPAAPDADDWRAVRMVLEDVDRMLAAKCSYTEEG